MKLFVDGKTYDSRMTPILIEFDDQEAKALELQCNRLIAFPHYMTQKEKMGLASKDLSRMGYLEMFVEPRE